MSGKLICPDREISKGMSNFDHEIDDGFAKELMENENKVYGYHVGINFYGNVWFAGGLFHEEIRVHHVVQEIISASSLEDLMKLVSDKYGWE